MEFRNCWAKINLSLRVVGRLQSGYHDLCSVFFKIGPVDCLTINEDVEDNVRVIFSRTKSGIQGRNILLKALDRIRAAGIAVPPLDMRLEKRVPPGTGLGGGSGDAAALLDCLASAGYPVERFAAEIGADVPFLLRRPLRRLRGERGKNSRRCALPLLDGELSSSYRRGVVLRSICSPGWTNTFMTNGKAQANGRALKRATSSTDCARRVLRPAAERFLRAASKRAQRISGAFCGFLSGRSHCLGNQRQRQLCLCLVEQGRLLRFQRHVALGGGRACFLN